MIDYYALFQHQINIIEHYGLPAIFLSTTIENLGIPFPTEAAFLVAIGLITSSKLSFLEAWIIINGGMLTGSIISYFLGFYGENFYAERLKKSKRVHKTREVLHKWFEKYGALAILGSKLIGYVRPWSSFVIGIAGVPFGKFLFWTCIGTSIITYIDLLISKQVINIWLMYPEYRQIFSVILFAIVFGFFIYLIASVVVSRIRKYHKRKSK
ncbi:TPA: hypothetical protein DDW69_00075 [candidate division CPR2 bacterium]|uniref:VTT domain-containing protein n=1 Tax=candidate division CPR2 bacterium GW2011_GWC1_41_48 TaxID=1618344 RepID=A0A0G0YGS0_UNCC2|nr:MAG: hypothetical protein UT47_C0005G0052 [candidate division CPR2 bacterium GW2011_GWC2_39_35]KKR27608.1 MAG: hypothetical protein UT59_C0052G0005 [candidate division CPR2 bacterium GW2011_GWD1_39_7]KKR28244.1 MAG: hypothetical protein UT60_C0024G0003 [candidate division CPR2 bacterium GW2011_GWD2_39_7]KKS08741.1 MAG: hypothetical protein UU65_C0005G0052 [candidate division CPR2 bacterium GW2011_GWC1_41_48]OGB58970.1 MAG: hypothetical protein A2Y27_02300 [candidate division CPR2 bacterium G